MLRMGFEEIMYEPKTKFKQFRQNLLQFIINANPPLVKYLNKKLAGVWGTDSSTPHLAMLRSE